MSLLTSPTWLPNCKECTYSIATAGNYIGQPFYINSTKPSFRSSFKKMTFFVFLLFLGPCFEEDVILKPIATRGKEAALLVIQGPGIDPKQYIPLAQSIQDMEPGVSLWIGVPQYSANTPAAIDLKKGIT